MKSLDDKEQSSHPHARSGSRAKWVFAGFLALAVFLLFTEHRAHVLGFLPWLILLACPLMHLFMHGGHDHGTKPKSVEGDET
ncbi:DUF2933 domain-containing protein [Aromatoleum aromaticum]|uniref:DUF2933 domain-containing protein n=1 Tax=Aromatoleum aromaticum (strain DSM 19018 / LMG 30748 / EbN1) TaxID=76114 RepID=Q5P5T3_AROAE|nr:DUF2933 domain-containing protein [Aromatoleum aromaticum]NMG53957.1 DUF2933 domain-containing protein [Aromatoleum aromaticum]CAI07329.1 hypothetical protein ebB64 [Aromatoleum aromaticum EbN1]